MWPKVRSLVAAVSTRARRGRPRRGDRSHIQSRAQDLVARGVYPSAAERPGAHRVRIHRTIQGGVRGARGLRLIASCARSALRTARAAPGARLYRRRLDLARTGHRRQHARFQPGRLDAPSTAVAAGTGPARHDLECSRCDEAGPAGHLQHPEVLRPQGYDPFLRVGGCAQRYRVRHQEPRLRAERRRAGTDSGTDGVTVDVSHARVQPFIGRALPTLKIRSIRWLPSWF